MRTITGLFAAAVAVVGVWGCSDFRDPTSSITTVSVQSSIEGCDLQAVRGAAQRYFGATTYQYHVADKLLQIEAEGCSGEVSERLAWEILAMVESFFYARRGGAASDGADVVNGLLRCCIPSGGSFTLAPDALAMDGIFGVRGALPGAAPAISNSAPILSRDPVPVLFGSEDGNQVVRPAVYAVRPQPPLSWQDVAFGSGVPGTFTDDVTLITGIPVGQAPHAGYEMNEAPDLGFEPGSQVDVIACFTDGEGAPPDPHGEDGEGSFTVRMQRDGVLLEAASDVQAFCQEWVWGPRGIGTEAVASSPLSTLLRWAGSVVLPQPLHAALRVDRTTPGFGGSASYFSRFRLTNASTDGSLTFVQEPPAVVPSPHTQFTVAVKAASGGGTAIEKVEITLYRQGNFGVPGEIVGTFQRCDGTETSDPVGCTDELDGIATFDLSLNRTGAYRLCARGVLDGFTFVDVCAERLTVRN